jgi:hypothetical protein
VLDKLDAHQKQQLGCSATQQQHLGRLSNNNNNNNNLDAQQHNISSQLGPQQHINLHLSASLVTSTTCGAQQHNTVAATTWVLQRQH